MDNFYSFYKRHTSPYTNSLPSDKTHKTPNTQTHHQSTARLMKMDHRKSGKNNLVAKSHTFQLKNPVVDRFINNNSKILSPLNWAQAKPILFDYNINHDLDSEESYTKALNRLKCNVTGLQVYIQYNPNNEIWTLFKK